tara:strand:+ start:6906 stop:7535 length:630 start_codon:yes stop_codon:yes gene_type:complete
MAITTNAQLKTAVANWLDRSDLTTRIPEFITLAEAKFNRVIRQPDMITRKDDFSIAGRYTTLETDTLEVLRIVLDVDPPVTLEYLTNEEIAELRRELSSTGKPSYFTIIGGSSNQLEVLRSPDKTYTASIVYYTRIPALDADGDSNWLLASHPDIYLFGALMEAEPYLKNDERVIFATRLETALAELNLQGERERHTGGSLRMRSRVLG